MRIAVTCENGAVFQHFGRTPEFAIFEIEEGRIIALKTEATNGTGHGDLAAWLQERHVDLLICGGIGGGAQRALADAGIRLLGGASGDVVCVVGDYLKGCLETDSDFSCHHHHSDGNHQCGGHHHGDGNHQCGGHCH